MLASVNPPSIRYQRLPLRVDEIHRSGVIGRHEVRPVHNHTVMEIGDAPLAVDQVQFIRGLIGRVLGCEHPTYPQRADDIATDSVRDGTIPLLTIGVDENAVQNHDLSARIPPFRLSGGEE